MNDDPTYAQFSAAIAGAVPIGLHEMDAHHLLSRVDRKYVVPVEKMDGLLQSILPSYSILEVGIHRIFTYQTLYFDTVDFRFYRDHHNGLLNRIKVRCRQYEETGATFFEIKRKYGGFRTDKYRRAIAAPITQLNAEEYGELATIFPKHAGAVLLPTLHNTFRRFTMVHPVLHERCTVDFGLRFSRNGCEKSVSDVAVIEVKQAKSSEGSPMIQELKRLHLHPCSISKYAFGLSLTEDGIKKNAFKKTFHQIKKITGRPVAA